MPIKLVDPTVKAQGGVTSPIADALSQAVVAYSSNIPTQEETAKTNLVNLNSKKLQNEIGASKKLADVFRMAYDKTSATPVDDRVQQNIPALVEAMGEAGQYGPIANMIRTYVANTPGLKDTKMIDRSMLGAGDSYSSTIGGFREEQGNKNVRAKEVADRLAKTGGQGKPPTGYIWGERDTETGNPTLVPVKGGPGTDMSAELAGRIGIAQSFLQEYKGLRNEITEGKLSGPEALAGQFFRAGDAGRINRRILSGVDALRRMLTGAGMPPTEAEEYVQRYQPELTDRPETKLDKLDGLAKDLSNQYEVSTRGRRSPADEKVMREYVTRDAAPNQPVEQNGTSGDDTSGLSNEDLLRMIEGL